jgi:hypothetical protein
MYTELNKVHCASARHNKHTVLLELCAPGNRLQAQAPALSCPLPSRQLSAHAPCVSIHTGHPAKAAGAGTRQQNIHITISVSGLLHTA